MIYSKHIRKDVNVMNKHNKVKMYSNGTCMHISIDGVELNHILSAEIKKGGSYPKLLLEIECDIETLNKDEYKKCVLDKHTND